MRISPHHSTQEWRSLKFDSEQDWATAIEIFIDRIHCRFLKYVEKIRGDKHSGFVILAIDCLLIETLMQFIKGVPETPKGMHKDYYVECLTCEIFEFTEEEAVKFYDHFRNGIVHQAEIKSSSKVRKGAIPLIKHETDGKGIIINRDLFHVCFETAIEKYIMKLKDPANVKLRNRFRLKMDLICGRMLYFAYGPNMESSVIDKYAPRNRFIGVGKLEKHAIAFNKKSVKYNSGVANIIKQKYSEVWGALFLIDPANLKELDKKEDDYKKDFHKVVLFNDVRMMATMTYVARKTTNGFLPKRSYLDGIIKGAHERGLPADYISMLCKINTDD